MRLFRQKLIRGKLTERLSLYRYSVISSRHTFQGMFVLSMVYTDIAE